MNTDTQAEYPPVKVSDEAHLALSQFIRKTSGLATASLALGVPLVSPFASFNRAESRFVANPDRLVLNPNRVYLTVTPFRMRQEAVMTGALLHEASHARHTKWTPNNEAELKAMVHGPERTADNMGVPVPVSKQTLAFAKLAEEPRIEGIMAVEADSIGAFGLGWTMRASAAHLIPTTSLTVNDPGQRIMDLITSWVLRAGRQLSINHHITLTGATYGMPQWVGDFGKLLHSELTKHEVTETVNGEPVTKMLGPIQANVVKRLLTDMACAGTKADTGTYMVDTARDVLDILFPETTGDEDDAPMPGDPMHSPEGDDEETEAGESASMPGEGDPDQGSEDREGSQEGQDGDEPDDQGSGGGESPGEGDSPADGASGDQPASPSSEGQGDGQGDGQGEGDQAQADATSAILASIEAEADNDTTAEADAKAAEAPPVEPTQVGGSGSGQRESQSGWRDPEPDEREVAQSAQRFLRDLINPSETSKTTLSESPSATVDGQALAVWKAGGQRTEPAFFARTRRTVTPAPPVKIAVLVDVSQSMTSLQKPSALLSWALASGAIDLRNFAGRGVQVESCLIHWGTSVRVVQANGAGLPGIREVGCNDGTTAMDKALEEVDNQMPGFFDMGERPEHRLLVQFTDWELNGGIIETADHVGRALEAGVNMLSVVPSSYSTRRTELTRVLEMARKARPAQRGRTSLMKYDPRAFATPADVWSEARALLQ